MLDLKCPVWFQMAPELLHLYLSNVQLVNVSFYFGLKHCVSKTAPLLLNVMLHQSNWNTHAGDVSGMCSF